MSAIRKVTGCSTALLTMLTAGLAQPVLAQEPPQPAPSAEAPVKDGEIIYSRDVHHSIGAQHFPGETDAAVTAPARVMIDTVALGLVPLTDREGAAITASVPAVMAELGLAEMPLSNGQGGIAGGLGEVIVSQTASGSAGSAISSAMGALSGALESLSAIPGGRP